MRDASLPAGAHTLAWNGLDDAGVSAPSGVYLLRVVSGTESRTARIARIP